MKTKPLVSVIIPNYNHGKFLDKRLQTVFNQTFQDFEVIILDDCSADNSKEIIEKYRKHPKVSTVLYNRVNGGSPFKQWIKGIENAQGEYLWIAESDDWCEPSLLQVLVSGMNLDRNCMISYCQSNFTDEENLILWRSEHPRISELIDGAAFIENYLSVRIAIFNASMALFRRTEINFTEEMLKFRFCGDWFFWLQLARRGKVHISGRTLNYFRNHADDLSGKVYKSGYNLIEEINISNWMYDEGLISDNVYRNALKKHFLGYWRGRKTMDPAIKEKVSGLFGQLRAKGLSQNSIKFSVIWSIIKHRNKL